MTLPAPPWPDRSLDGDKAAARAQAHAVAKALPAGDGAVEAALPLLAGTRGRVGIYRPLASEAGLGPLLEEPFRNRVAYVRAAADFSLTFVAWDHVTAWTPDHLNMLAPPLSCGVVADDTVTVVLVPGLAFTQGGARLGRGKGCYDRTLSRVPHALRVAVTHERCLFAQLPVDGRDEPVDVVITEARLHWTLARGRTTG